MITGFMIYIDELAAFDQFLTNEELGKIVRALYRYAKDGADEAPNVKPVGIACYTIMRQKIDRDFAEYEKKAKAGRRSGESRRGNTPSTACVPNTNEVCSNTNNSVPNTSENVPVTVPVTVTETVTVPVTVTEGGVGETDADASSSARPVKRFTKPTVDEVRSFVREQGYDVDPDAFVAYYESNGWRVGRNPMKDWHAAVRTWTRNSYGSGASKPKKTVTAQNFPQREYSEASLEAQFGAEFMAMAERGADEA